MALRFGAQAGEVPPCCSSPTHSPSWISMLNGAEAQRNIQSFPSYADSTRGPCKGAHNKQEETRRAKRDTNGSFYFYLREDLGTHTKVIDNPPKFVTVMSVNLRE